MDRKLIPFPRRRIAALRPVLVAAPVGAALAMVIFAASFALPVQDTPALRRALVDLPAAALALIGAPDTVWRSVAGGPL